MRLRCGATVAFMLPLHGRDTHTRSHVSDNTPAFFPATFFHCCFLYCMVRVCARVQSYKRSAKASEDGLLAKEIVPVNIPQRKRDDKVCAYARCVCVPRACVCVLRVLWCML